MRAFPHVTQPGPATPRSQNPHVPTPPQQPQQQQQQQQQQLSPPQEPSHHRTGSFPLRQSSLSSDSSQNTALSTTPRPSFVNHPSALDSSSSISSTPRNATPNDLSQARTYLTDSPLRQGPANMSPTIGSGSQARDRSRQHSQGFFEPSLRTASHREPSIMANSNLSASQIAAQAAMHVQNGKQQQQHQQTQHERRRSQTSTEPAAGFLSTASRKPKNIAPLQLQGSTGLPALAASRTTPIGGGPSTSAMKSAATTAASAAYPRSPLGSPFMPFASNSRPTSPAEQDPSRPPEKEKSSRRKMFLKPSKLHISKEKDSGKTTPRTAGIYGSANLAGSFNHSTTSLVDPTTPATAIYSSANASTSTLVPSDRVQGAEKEKHRHNFLSRQKHKLKDEHAIALSSASSNSRPIDPNMPQSLYSFAPSSPSLASKSFSGLDLRHGGRALREKKKEKDAQNVFALPMPQLSNMSTEALTRADTADLAAVFGPMSNTSQNSYNADLGIPTQGLTGFGLQNMGVDDAWPLLKARLLNIFGGEDLRTPIEDFNRLAGTHLQRSLARRAPAMLIEDIRDLFNTGFTSLDMTLRNVPDDRIVPHLVEAWGFVFGNVMPFMQAVFLPLDLEFRGHGSVLKDPREAAEFWSAAVMGMARPGTANTDSTVNKSGVASKPALEIRTLVLHSFRSYIILPRYDTLLAIFSRLSLDTIATPSFATDLPTPPAFGTRPGTAASSGSGGHIDPSSYNSQGSTLLDSSTAGSFGARSRATSNTSAGSFASLPSRGRERAGTNHSLTSAIPPATAAMAMDSTRVTATAARMLQCVSVLASLGRVGDEENAEASARKKMERLAKELKLNWLGRSRMGRDRRGLVGTKIRGPIGVGVGVGA